jgi:hypothetical protein
MTDRPAERATGGPSRDRRATDTAAVPRSVARSAATAAAGVRRPMGGPSAAGGSTTATTARPAPRTARRARLNLTRIDPWSVMKMTFLLSIALGIVTIVAVLILWGVLGAAGVWDSINQSVNDIVGDGSTWDVSNYLGTSRVLGFTMIVAVIDVVLFTVLATLGAFLYNMAAALLGGVEVTLTEEQ